MDKISKKLLDGGVSSEIIAKLKAGLGNTFETELVTNGLTATAEKIGIDPSNLPYIDREEFAHAMKELTGKDIDGNGKTGIGEALEDIGHSFKNTEGIVAKIK